MDIKKTLYKKLSKLLSTFEKKVCTLHQRTSSGDANCTFASLFFLQSHPELCHLSYNAMRNISKQCCWTDKSCETWLVACRGCSRSR